MVFNVSTESGRAAMPRCTCATFSGDILRIMRSAPSTRSGRISRVVLPNSFGIMRFEERLGAALENIVRGLQAGGAGFGTVGRGFRVAQGERGDAATMFSPELKQRVAADGDSDQRSAADIGVVHHAAMSAACFSIVAGPSPTPDSPCPRRSGRISAIARGEHFGDGQPEFMIGGKRMQQDDGRAVAERPVDDFGVAALDALGGNALHAGD